MNTAIENQQTPWYAVQTRPNWEKLSAGMLADKGYQVFYPARPTKGNMDRPLFPSYLFCRSTTDSFGRIVSTPGVIRLLGRPGHPECVPDAEIAGVRQLLEAGMPVDEGVGLARGQRVRIRFACGSRRRSSRRGGKSATSGFHLLVAALRFCRARSIVARIGNGP